MFCCVLLCLSFVFLSECLSILYMYMYMNTKTLRKKERGKERQSNTKQHNTTQDLRQLFQKKRLHSGGTRTHASHFLDVMLYKLSY